MKYEGSYRTLHSNYLIESSCVSIERDRGLIFANKTPEWRDWTAIYSSRRHAQEAIISRHLASKESEKVGQSGKHLIATQFFTAKTKLTVPIILPKSIDATFSAIILLNLL